MKKQYWLVLILLLVCLISCKNEVESKFATKTIFAGSQGVELSVPAKKNSTYQWYLDFRPIEGATNNNYTFVPDANKGVFKLYCITTSNNGSQEFSDSFNVVRTGLPTLSIKTEHASNILSKEVYLKALLSVESDKAEYCLENVEIDIASRGQYSYQGDKKPYKFKVTKAPDGKKKINILGINESKQKSWILLANYFDNSYIRPYVAEWACKATGTDWTVNGKSVDLVINGEYVGNYFLCDAVKIDKDRVNISDEHGLLFYVDIADDQDFCFNSQIKNFPYNLKEPDTEDMVGPRANDFEDFKTYLNNLEQILYSDAFSTMSEQEIAQTGLDVESFAQWYIANELIDNLEVNIPKSVYCTYDLDELGNPVFKMGPGWDFDFSFRNQIGNNNTPSSDSAFYFDALLKNNVFRAMVKKIWNENIMPNKEDLFDYIDEVVEEIRLSVNLDIQLWGIRDDIYHSLYLSFDDNVRFIETCLHERIDWMNNRYNSETWLLN